MRRFLLTASLALVLTPLLAVAPGGRASAQTQAPASAGGDNFNLSSVDALLAKGTAKPPVATSARR